MSEATPDLKAPPEHPLGCTYGGFSCGYWIVVDGCELPHPETHLVTDDMCPCEISFPGAGSGKFVADAHDRPLPPELQAGIGTPLEREASWYVVDERIGEHGEIRTIVERERDAQEEE